MMNLCISLGNSKIGRTASVSLPTGITCPPNAPCLAECYAASLELYNKVRKAWLRNWELYRLGPETYFATINKFLAGYGGKYFRWHVSGDIPDQFYLDNMVALARAYPFIKFAAFTKQYGYDYSGMPENLSIVFSIWPGYPLPDNTAIPFAWYQDGSENRMPQTAVPCRHACEGCRLCWDKKALAKTGVVFFKRKQLRLFALQAYRTKVVRSGRVVEL